MINKLFANEITESVNDILKKRVTSPVYGTFFISWVIFHWRLVYTMFFVSEEMIWQATRSLRSDYILKTYFNYNDWTFWLYMALPFAITYLAIWHFPRYVGLPAFTKDEEYRIQKKKIRLIKQRELEVEETKTELKNVEKLEAVVQKTQKEQDIKKIDPTISWQEDYEVFKTTPFYNTFDYIIESIYEKRGDIITYVYNEIEFQIPKNLMAYSHTNGLIDIIEDGNRRYIELTEKGKFFVKLFTQERGKA